MFKYSWLSVIVLALLPSLCGAQSLRQEADKAGLLVSTAVRPSLLSEAPYATTLAREFNIVEAEGAMKRWVLRPDEASYDFRQGDENSSLRSSTRNESPRALSRVGTL